MKSRLQSFRNLRIWIFALGGGIFFAAFDRFGYMLKNYGSILALSENPWHRTVFHRILCRLPVSVLSVCLLLAAADWIRQRGRSGITSFGRRWERFSKRRHWPLWMWLLYFVSFLPAFLGGYPGLFAADAPNQIGWTFSGWLTAHHPLLHTGILCGIFALFRALGLSDNAAAAFYTLLQMLALSGIFAWISRFLRREDAPTWIQAGTALYLCLFPFHGMMAVYTTKDTLFSGVFALCAMQAWQMCARPEEYFEGYRHILAGGGCFALLFLFRNNGFHTLFLCLPFLFAYLRQRWKKLALLFAGLLAVYQFYNGPFLRLLGAEPGNSREAYSVIMQTLGRVYTAGGDIRPEEMEVIRPVMSEDVLSSYAPNLSDPIKNFFCTEAFDQNKSGFLKAWLAVGWRNKKIYIDAVLSLTEAFWHPDAEGEYLEFVCFDIEEGNPAYPHVRMKPLSRLFNRYYTAIGTDASFRRIWGVRELLSMGFYFWLMAFAALYALYKREPDKLMGMLLFWTYMGTCMLGPAALLRYAYPVMLGAPLLVYMMLSSQEAG